MNNNRTYSPILSIRIPEELMQQIDRLTETTGLSKSAVVRLCITQGTRSVEKIASSLADKPDNCQDI